VLPLLMEFYPGKSDEMKSDEMRGYSQ